MWWGDCTHSSCGGGVEVSGMTDFNTTERRLKNLLSNFFILFYTAFTKRPLKTPSFSCIGGFWGLSRFFQNLDENLAF